MAMLLKETSIMFNYGSACRTIKRKKHVLKSAKQGFNHVRWVHIQRHLFTFQLRLYAVDGSSLAGFASRTAVATLIINVNRNIFPPVFTNNNNIGVTISESAFVGSFIVDLNATDADVTVSNIILLL